MTYRVLSLPGKLGTDWFGIKVYEKGITSHLSGNIQVTRFGYRSTGNVVYDRIRYIRDIRKKIKQSHYDLVHITNPHFSYIANFIECKRLIVSCHDSRGFMGVDGRFILWVFNKMGIRKADAIITLSKYSKNQIAMLLKYPLHKIYVITEGVNKKIFHEKPDGDNLWDTYGFDKETKIILFVGSDAHWKNIGTAIHTASLLSNEYNIFFVKVGFNKHGTNITDLFTFYNIDNYKIFEDISTLQLADFYNIADVFICPTLDEGGFALPVLEAMSCGCPVVLSNIQPFRELLQGFDIPMVNPLNSHGFACIIREIFKNWRYKELLVWEGYRVVDKYNWVNSSVMLEQLYEKILNE